MNYSPGPLLPSIQRAALPASTCGRARRVFTFLMLPLLMLILAVTYQCLSPFAAVYAQSAADIQRDYPRADQTVPVMQGLSQPGDPLELAEIRIFPAKNNDQYHANFDVKFSLVNRSSKPIINLTFSMLDDFADEVLIFEKQKKLIHTGETIIERHQHFIRSDINKRKAYYLKISEVVFADGTKWRNKIDVHKFINQPANLTTPILAEIGDDSSADQILKNRALQLALRHFKSMNSRKQSCMQLPGYVSQYSPIDKIFSIRRDSRDPKISEEDETVLKVDLINNRVLKIVDGEWLDRALQECPENNH